MPSMEEAAQIRDVAARHAYVFDNGLSSPDFFDVEKRKASDEFALLLKHCATEQWILEVGCFTGLNLIGLAQHGYEHLIGLEFVQGAVDWLIAQSMQRGLRISANCATFPECRRLLHVIGQVDRVVCFDVLEHQLNVGEFLWRVHEQLKPDGQALFLVPENRHYYDCGHCAFWPDAECLRNVLDYFFDVQEIRRLDSCPKLFAVCQRRD